MKLSLKLPLLSRKKTMEKEKTDEGGNQARRESVEKGALSLVETVLLRKRRSMMIIFLLCAILIAGSGASRHYLGKQALKMMERENRAANQIKKELSDISKRAAEVLSLSELAVPVPLINQFSVIAMSAYGKLVLRNIQYDRPIDSLKDVFFIETGRDAKDAVSGGLWTIDGISLEEQAGSFVRQLKEQAKKHLGMEAYITTSGGQGRGTSTSILVRIVFWRAK